MQILLDTHVLLWLRKGDRKLWKEHQRQIDKARSRAEKIGIAAITLWEIALLAAGGRVRLHSDTSEFLAELEANEDFAVLPLTAAIASESMRLGNDFPRDPADQLIAATARTHGLRLLTADERIRKSGAVEVG